MAASKEKAHVQMVVNNTFDFCIFTVDESEIFRDELPYPEPEKLLEEDTFIPYMMELLMSHCYSKEAIIICQNEDKISSQL